MNDISMNYDLMRRMVKALDDAEDTLQEAQIRLAAIAEGNSTDTHGRAMGMFYLNISDVVNEIRTLYAWVAELGPAVDAARRALEEGDTSAAGRFR